MISVNVCTATEVALRTPQRSPRMNNAIKGLIAGLGAWKLGGGCLSTIIIFLLIFWLLGYL